MFFTYFVAEGINNYYYPALISIGTVGNILSFLVSWFYRRKDFQFCWTQVNLPLMPPKWEYHRHWVQHYQSTFFEIPAELVNLANLPNTSAKLKQLWYTEWSTHLSILLGANIVTSLVRPFVLTVSLLGHVFICWPLQDGLALNFNFFTKV